MKTKIDPVKGCTLITTKTIGKGVCLGEYFGTIVNNNNNNDNDKETKATINIIGSYTFFLKDMQIDASEAPCVFKYCNHSKTKANVKSKKITKQDGSKGIIFISMRKILPEEEILYDYGETDKEIIKDNPWLQN